MISGETLKVRAQDGATLMLRRYLLAGRPRLILSHGNGFAMDGYRAFWELLSVDYELVLFDLRNHGTSAVTPVKAHTIKAMADDHVTVATTCRPLSDGGVELVCPGDYEAKIYG